MDEFAFLEESHRLCSPEYDDIGCYVHQDGVAMVWDFEHSVYIPYGARASKWPHPIEEFPAPIITNTDLPEKYISCSIDECVNLVACGDTGVSSRPQNHMMLPEEECLGCETGTDCPDAHDENRTLNQEIDEGCDLVRTTGYYTSPNLESDVERLVQLPELDWADHDTPSPPPRVTTPLSESDKSEMSDKSETSEQSKQSKQSEKSEKDAIVSFIKKSDKTGETQFYVATFENGETCYIPSHISKHKLNLNDKIDVTAFATEGHGNQWRASYVKGNTNMEFTIMCEDTDGNWGFLIGSGGSTLKEMAKESSPPWLPPPTIIIKPEDNSTATIVVKSYHEHTDFEKLKENIFNRGEQFGYVIHFK